MVRKVWLMNLVTAGLIAFLWTETYKVWSEEDERAAPEVAEARNRVGQIAKTIARRTTLPESDYESVARNNLFNRERAEPKAEPTPETKIGKVSVKTIALQGVIITNDFKTALVENLERKAGEKQREWIKVGDAVAGFNLIEIKQESIIISDGADQYEVFLYDKDMPRKATAISKKEIKPTVVSAEPPKKPSTDRWAGKADDSKTASEESMDASETKYQHVKQPSEELRRKIISQYRDFPPPPPPQLNEPTGKGDWDIPVQQYQKETSKSADSKPDATKTRGKTGRDRE